MGLKREFSIVVQKFIDEWLPPVICDAKWFVRIPMKLFFKNAADDVMYFREKAFAMTDEEFAGVYRRVYGQIADRGTLTRDTDLNKRCVKQILSSLRGDTVLDVGAGRGYLAGLMSQTHKVTAVDMVVTDNVRKAYPQVTFVESHLEQLPFADAEFDTVVCTHTLEHVQNLPRAITELRRVARKSVIVVVPRERPYKYGFALHLHFFPYAWSLHGQFGYSPDATITNLGDWFYEQDMESTRRRVSYQTGDGDEGA
jgi:ubiquinone/menaquinone biosynthesis C-methylase UbiE